MAEDWDDEPAEWADGDDDEGIETVTCPHCREEVYEDAEQCPYCGEWITRNTHPLAGRSTGFILLGIVGIGAVIAALVFAGF